MHKGIWTPRMTVSAVIEREGKFLLVEERDDLGRKTLNQPAGHLEDNESLIQAVEREVLEETGYRFQPQAFTGLYRWQAKQAGLTFIRVNFIGTISPEVVSEQLDDDIIATHWLRPDQVTAKNIRSPLVIRCIDDYLNRPHYPLSALVDQK